METPVNYQKITKFPIHSKMLGLRLLQEIDWKMSRIESILQQVSVDGLIEEAYEIHEMLLKVSQLLLILQQDLKMTPLAKGLSLQLQSIQEQYNQLFSKGEIS
ncbi:hypothetical protein ACT7DB_31015 [Bacillus cereus]